MPRSYHAILFKADVVAAFTLLRWMLTSIFKCALTVWMSLSILYWSISCSSSQMITEQQTLTPGFIRPYWELRKTISCFRLYLWHLFLISPIMFYRTSSHLLITYVIHSYLNELYQHILNLSHRPMGSTED